MFCLTMREGFLEIWTRKANREKSTDIKAIFQVPRRSPPPSQQAQHDIRNQRIVASTHLGERINAPTDPLEESLGNIEQYAYQETVGCQNCRDKSFHAEKNCQD